MTHALERCFTLPEDTAVLIDPVQTNERAQNFYRRMGFEVMGPRVFEKDECLVMRIDRRRWIEFNVENSGR